MVKAVEIITFVDNDKTPEEINEINEAFKLFSPKLIILLHKTLNNLDITEYEHEYIKTYKFLVVEDFLKKYRIKKGKLKSYDYFSSLIDRRYKKIDKSLEEKLKDEGLGLNTVNGTNVEEKIQQRKIRYSFHLDIMDSEFITNIEVVLQSKKTELVLNSSS